jgi:hypothetical protein
MATMTPFIVKFTLDSTQGKNKIGTKLRAAPWSTKKSLTGSKIQGR